MSQKIKLCAICGINNATTREHVPPKGIFIKPRPVDLINVPAVLTAIIQPPLRMKISGSIWAFMSQDILIKENSFLKKLLFSQPKKNIKLRKQIIVSNKPALLKTPGGIIVDMAVIVPWDSDAHDKTIDKIIRGLFYHHHGKIIGSNAEIKVHFFNEFPVLDIQLDNYSIGYGIFRYGFRKVDDAEYSSVWLFNFYNGHLAGGYTVKKQYETT
ncbi:MAG: hypothetical protein IPP79_14440 [Chitinophagaceae bacterium]|nr:hypothetical protein [Chitinophagaceae bacterium]